jgi:hypothetical protein
VESPRHPVDNLPVPTQPHSCKCIEEACAGCRDEWQAVWRVASLARALVDNIEHGSLLTHVTADQLREQLDHLESVMDEAADAREAEAAPRAVA